MELEAFVVGTLGSWDPENEPYYTLAEIIPTCSESCAAYQLFQEATIYGKLYGVVLNFNFKITKS